MTSSSQKNKAIQFREMHNGPSILVLPNAWDAASARISERAGFRAIATTSSGVAASLGFPDGQRISKDMLVEVVEHMTRVITCPITVDIEAGFGNTIAEVAETVKSVVAAGAVGINIEDSTKGQKQSLVDVSFQVELLKTIRELALAIDIPLVINARIDVFLLKKGDPSEQFEEAVKRGKAYQQAGADCLFPIGLRDEHIITGLVQAIDAPINILVGPATPSINDLAQRGVARVSFGSGMMRATLAHLHHIARELLEFGTCTSMLEETLSGTELRSLSEREV